MREYSPKRRTALVLAGSGSSGAYHAGVLKALDESGVKLDLVVGSGAGAVAAAFAAIAGGAKLYGPDGFWSEAGWDSFYRLRTPARVALLLLGAAFGVFMLPLALAVIAGMLFPLVLVADLVSPGLPARLVGDAWSVPAALRTPYLAALAVPVFSLCALAILYLARLYVGDRRRFAEGFESLLDARPARERLSRSLWEVVRGAATSPAPPPPELSRRYVALLAENLGQPGFRELILRAADLEAGAALPFVVLQDAARASFAGRKRGPRSRVEGMTDAVDLRSSGYDALLFDAVLTGLLPPLVAPVRRIAFPRGGLYAGETRRITDGTLAAGCGIAEALAAGAEQVIVASAVPEAPALPPRRRGARPLADAVLASLERQSLDADLRVAERTNRMIETLGHRTEAGGHAWEDPATGRVFREVALYVVRPDRRALGPLELDGAQDPSTEVRETPADLLEQGYRDAFRLFVEPVVGAVPEPRREEALEGVLRAPVEL
ncbi:MAG TPA: patatin-like phospholipase family protein [Vicinamibacteria bacterium]|jgi:predicted acylesterase/phospholipase RssA|nr:patatin-like phospholipase family protein [Vicinamibacteria bacterium]